MNNKPFFNIVKWADRVKVNSSQIITNFSLSKKLKEERKITKETEIAINNLSLEEVIGLKLELAARSFGGSCFGMPIWFSLKNIVSDAIVKYVWSMATTNKEKYTFLGLSPLQYYKLIYKFQPERYFYNNPIRFDKEYQKLHKKILGIAKTLKRKFKV